MEKILVLEEQSNSKHMLQRGLSKGDVLLSLCWEKRREGFKTSVNEQHGCLTQLFEKLYLRTYHSLAPKMVFVIVTGDLISCQVKPSLWAIFLPFDGLSHTLSSPFSWNCNLHILVQAHALVKFCLTATTPVPPLRSQSPNLYPIFIAQNSSRGKQPFHHTSWGTKVPWKVIY